MSRPRSRRSRLLLISTAVILLVAGVIAALLLGRERPAFPDAIWVRRAPPPSMLAEPRAYTTPGGEEFAGITAIVGRSARLYTRPSPFERLLQRFRTGPADLPSRGYVIANDDASAASPDWVRLVPDPGED